MSQPSIPNITPTISISRQQAISLLLSSIAMDELAVSHLINAEAEKIQAFVGHVSECCNIGTKDFIRFNNGVSHFIEGVTMKQWLALNKLDRIIQITGDHLSDDECFEENCEE
ncbi:hypothetical protein [Cohnella sp. WQ 127256]|uniref:hypothetical protein n=1 Tax=Cohnella sp. WQ 127256 TaxID=2938790 RepID=UPI002118B5F4|nr:hypothetical protein [Cohnella sp. WQ 127256]